MADLDQHQQETPGEESGATRRNASSADMGAPEVIEVEVERLGVRPSAMKAMSGRVWNAVGPVVLAVFIDAGDFLTGGPLIFLGVPLLAGDGRHAGNVQHTTARRLEVRVSQLAAEEHAAQIYIH